MERRRRRRSGALEAEDFDELIEVYYVKMF